MSNTSDGRMTLFHCFSNDKIKIFDLGYGGNSRALYNLSSKSASILSAAITIDRWTGAWSIHLAPAGRVFFVLDKNCWVCEKWLLHFTVTAPKTGSKQESPVTVECSNHFAHIQQFFPTQKILCPQG